VSTCLHFVHGFSMEKMRKLNFFRPWYKAQGKR
jgi:hypothetical protein